MVGEYKSPHLTLVHGDGDLTQASMDEQRKLLVLLRFHGNLRTEEMKPDVTMTPLPCSHHPMSIGHGGAGSASLGEKDACPGMSIFKSSFQKNPHAFVFNWIWRGSHPRNGCANSP